MPFNKAISIVNAYKKLENGKDIKTWAYTYGLLRSGGGTLFVKSSKGVSERPVNIHVHSAGSVMRPASRFGRTLKPKTPYDRPEPRDPDTDVILTMEEAVDFANAIDTMYVGSSHTDVKTNTTWKAMYHMKDRPMAFKGTVAHSGPTHVMITTIPCHSCGIILPDDAIQVDHYMPQASVESLYVTKTLRVLGLTTGAATGIKGTRFDINTAAYLTDDKIYPKGRDRGNLAYLSNNTPNPKWTTNEKGAAFLSLVASVDGLDDFGRMCKNSLLNLTPLCGLCNQRKSNIEKPIL